MKIRFNPKDLLAVALLIFVALHFAGTMGRVARELAEQIPLKSRLGVVMPPESIRDKMTLREIHE